MTGENVINSDAYCIFSVLEIILNFDYNIKHVNFNKELVSNLTLSNNGLAQRPVREPYMINLPC